MPPDVSVIYLYNPFRGEILQRFFENIRRSLEQAPRRLTVIYKNPGHFEREVDPFPWLVEKAEFECGTQRCLILQSAERAPTSR